MVVDDEVARGHGWRMRKAMMRYEGGSASTLALMQLPSGERVVDAIIEKSFCRSVIASNA